MNCYVHESQVRARPVGLSGLPERPAVAVCHECGAGVCSDHATVLDVPAFGRPTGTRLFACPTCAVAVAVADSRREGRRAA
jgi:hypothetical protein